MVSKYNRIYRIHAHGFLPTEVSALSLKEALENVPPIVRAAYIFAQVSPSPTPTPNDRSPWSICGESTTRPLGRELLERIRQNAEAGELGKLSAEDVIDSLSEHMQRKALRQVKH